MSAQPTPISLSTPLAYALAYASIGWHVLPLVPGEKRPHGKLAPNGHLNATLDEETIRRWWTACPDAGIGIAMQASGLVAIDIDPRNNGLLTMELLESEHGPLVSDVLAFTGGGGEHRVFVAGLVNALPGRLGPGVDVKADGYIAVEPTRHPSGAAYAWEASSDPLHGAVPSVLPEWIRDLARPVSISVGGSVHGVRFVDPRQVDELRSALAVLASDDYNVWVKYGLALCELGQAGFTLWDDWSQKSAKYSSQAAARKWWSFKPCDVHVETIFFDAQDAGWVNPMAKVDQPAAVPLHEVRVAAPEPGLQATSTLLRPPGILGVVADWIGATSRKPQPSFDVQAAIAFCCTVLGRRYVSTQRNWPSLYLLNIGKSASGKEHGKWAVERLLEACDLGSLIGPSSYTSNAGVLSALHDQPSHITVIDEFGKALDNASVKNNARDRSMLTALMEVWGRADGVLRPQGYSTFGMSAKDASSLKDRAVRNPALTLLAMTTPESFFDSIGSAAARDGFLNRFLIVESEIGRQVGQHAEQLPAPQEVIDWACRVRAAGSAGLVNHDSNPSMSPSPVVIPLDQPVLEMFKGFEAECIELMDANEQSGLAEMFGRSNEIAMRLALVVAMGCDNDCVESHHAAWAIEYVRHHAKRTVQRLATSVADSEVEANKQAVLALVRKAGAAGMTERDLEKSSRRFRGLLQRQQVELLGSLQFVGHIQRVEIPTSSGKGRPRCAWVAIDADADSDIPPTEDGSEE